MNTRLYLAQPKETIMKALKIALALGASAFATTASADAVEMPCTVADVSAFIDSVHVLCTAPLGTKTIGLLI